MQPFHLFYQMSCDFLYQLDIINLILYFDQFKRFTFAALSFNHDIIYTIETYPSILIHRTCIFTIYQ